MAAPTAAAATPAAATPAAAGAANLLDDPAAYLEKVTRIKTTRFPVLDNGKGWIELLDMLPSDGIGDLAIINAARVSYSGESAPWKNEADAKKDYRLLHYLMKHDHATPFEMATVKLRVRAPLITWWQWARHRAASYNAQSGRYVEFDEGDFYIPIEWRLQAKSGSKQASDHGGATLGEKDADASIHLTYKLEEMCKHGYELYKHAISLGIAREQARLFLPGFGVYYTWIVSMNIRSLMNFMRLRMAPDAQYEIRVYAQAIFDEIFSPLFPWTAEAFDKYTRQGGKN